MHNLNPLTEALAKRFGNASFEFPGYIEVNINDILHLEIGNVNETWMADLRGVKTATLFGTLDTGISGHSQEWDAIADSILAQAKLAGVK